MARIGVHQQLAPLLPCAHTVRDILRHLRRRNHRIRFGRNQQDRRYDFLNRYARTLHGSFVAICGLVELDSINRPLAIDA